ncbi:MAG: hypothetical protein ACX93O_11915 [Flagellimonas sp.]
MFGNAIIITIVFLSISYLGLLVLFKKNKKGFLLKYHNVLESLKKLEKGSHSNEPENLFNICLGYFRIFIMIYGFVLLLSWTSHFFIDTVIIILSILLLISCFSFYLKEIKASPFPFIFLIALLGFMMFSMCKSSNYTLMLFIPGLISGALISIRIDKFLKKLIPKIQFKLKNEGLNTHIDLLAKKIQSQNSFRNDLRENQAFLVVLAIALFVIIPRIKNLLPPYSHNHFTEIVERIEMIKPQLAVIVYVGYLVFVSTSVFPKVLDLFKYDKGLSWFRNAFNYIGDFLIFFFSLYFGLFVLLIFSILTFVGNLILGLDFALILGFFVFASWIGHILSYMVAIVLLFFPAKLKMNCV